MQTQKSKKQTTSPYKEFTPEHSKNLNEIGWDIYGIRKELEDLKGNDSISEVMFCIGSLHKLLESVEEKIEDLRESLTHDSEDEIELEY
jgi:hypothetical protein